MLSVVISDWHIVIIWIISKLWYYGVDDISPGLLANHHGFKVWNLYGTTWSAHVSIAFVKLSTALLLSGLPSWDMLYLRNQRAEHGPATWSKVQWVMFSGIRKQNTVLLLEVKSSDSWRMKIDHDMWQRVREAFSMRPGKMSSLCVWDIFYLVVLTVSQRYISDVMDDRKEESCSLTAELGWASKRFSHQQIVHSFKKKCNIFEVAFLLEKSV